jgi:hypothetical protein
MIIETAALISFGSWLGGKILDKGFDALSDTLIEIDEKNKFYEIVKTTSRELQVKYPDVLGGSIEHFFKHDEVFNELVKLLFSDSKVSLEIISKQFDLSTLPSNFLFDFINALRDNLLKNSTFSKILRSKEIYIICLGINNNLDGIKEATTLSYVEIKKIRELLESKIISDFDYDKFIEKYYKNALSNLSQVNIIGLGIDSSIKKGKRKGIDDVFVKPTFSFTTKTNERIILNRPARLYKRKKIIQYDNLLSIGNHLVVLGDPGSGKSFVVKSLICSIIKEQSELFPKNKFIPIRIELRKYLLYKKQKGGNVIDYLLYLFATEYGIDNLLRSSLEYIFRNKQIIMLFDGLDEIFNITDRIDVRNDIDNFINSYDCKFSITTSRIIGYEDASLSDEKYWELKINNFDDGQIYEYVQKWYSIEEDNQVVRDREIADFLDKKKNVNDELIANPLLLSLIVILYRNNLKLPESKLEVYQSCTSTLVDKWDVSKQLSIELDEQISVRKETILADLAYWQYTELTNNKTITFERAKSTVAKTLVQKLKIADEYSADVIAENFMDYALKRSIYFDNNFTHKTFLEYYTAFWIYTNIEKKHKKKERDELISRFIENSFWHIVLELLFNLIDKEQADDEMIDELINVQLLDVSKSISFILKVLPSLKNISAGQIENVFCKAILFLIETEVSDGDYRKEDKTRDVFKDIESFYSKEKYRELLQSAFIKVENINNAHRLYRLYFEVLTIKNVYDDPSRQYIFSSKSLEIVSKDSKLFKLYLLAFKDDELKREPVLNINEYIKRFGKDAAFEQTTSLYSGYFTFPFFSLCMRRIFFKENIPKMQQNLKVLSEIGFAFEDICYDILDNASPYVWTDVDGVELCREFEKTSDKKNKVLCLLEINNLLHSSMWKNIAFENSVIIDAALNQNNKDFLNEINTCDFFPGAESILKYYGVYTSKLQELIQGEIGEEDGDQLV